MARHRAPEDGADDGEAATTALPDLSGDYTVDGAHTRIGVRVRRARVTTVHGAFTRFAGTAHLDAAEPARSSVTLRIDAASLDTGNADRNAQLRSADVLDVQAHPEIAFVSTAVEPVEPAVLRVTGELTIKGTTRPVAVDVSVSGSSLDPLGHLCVGFEGALVLRPGGWNLIGDAALETGGVSVGDQMRIELDVSAIKDARRA